MKIIFLDFDGVLNCAKYLKSCGPGLAIDPTRMDLLKQLVDATDAKLVLTTSWREHWSRNLTECDPTGILIHEIFSRYGLQILDKTGQSPIPREAQIKSWLEAHPEVRHFVVLDDRLLSGDFLQGHFVKTSNYFDGLEEADVQKAIDILNR